MFLALTRKRFSVAVLLSLLVLMPGIRLRAEVEATVSKQEQALLKLLPQHIFSIPDPLAVAGKRKFSLSQPMSVAIDDQDGNIYVSDAKNRVVIFNEDGALLGSFGSSGSAPGQFNIPVSLHIDQTQRKLYVLDQRNWRVQVFKLSDELVESDEPAEESDDDQQVVVQKQVPLVEPTMIIPLPMGTVPQLGEQAVVKKNGVIYPTRSMDLATDSFGKVIVLDGGWHRFLLFNEQGEYLTKLGSVGKARDKFYFPKAFDLAEVEYLDEKNRKKKRIQYYVADTINRRISVVTERGDVLYLIGINETKKADFTMPTGVALDDQQNLYVVDRMSAECHVFDGDGQLIFSFGQEGDLYEKLYLPLQIAISSKRKRLCITDMGNDRLMVYKMSSQ